MWPWPLVPLLLGARAVTAARAPDAGVVGAELLVRAADQCDLVAVFRLMNSSSFSAKWFTRAGTSGETPLRAALRLGCPQVVAVMMLHPDFDFSTIAKYRKRTQLIQDVRQNADPGRLVGWALEVMEAIRIGRVAGPDFEWSKGTGLDWYLPKPGEWMMPVTLEEMGIDLRMEPAIPEFVVDISLTGGLLTTPDGVQGHADIVFHVWYVMVAYITAPAGSSRRSELARRIRSLGWTYFFGSPTALPRHTHLVDLLARGQLAAPGTPTVGRRALRGTELEYMGARLAELWSRIGDYIVVF